jgi:hypothetical protein
MGGRYKSIFLESMAGAGGAVGALSGALVLGMAFGIPGLILVTRENKKPKSSRNQTLLILGFMLMALGVALGLGFNAGGLVEGIANQFSN